MSDQEVKQTQIIAPLSGKAVNLEEVNDFVFQNKLAGDGLAIIPENEVLYSPVEGVVQVVFVTKHVIGIESNKGVKVILHVGIDTVEMKGEGFNVLVEEGQNVQVGDRLMEFDLTRIQQQFDPTVMICIEDSENYEFENRHLGRIQQGEILFKVKEK